MSLSRGPQRNPCKVEFEWGNDLHHYTSARTKESSPWAGRRLSLIHYPPLPSGRQPSFIISRLFSFYLHGVKKKLNWEINITRKQKFHDHLCWSWSYYPVSKRFVYHFFVCAYGFLIANVLIWRFLTGPLLQLCVLVFMRDAASLLFEVH